jgi:hypothetical protein
VAVIFPKWKVANGGSDRVRSILVNDRSSSEKGNLETIS